MKIRDSFTEQSIDFLHIQKIVWNICLIRGTYLYLAPDIYVFFMFMFTTMVFLVLIRQIFQIFLILELQIMQKLH